MEIYVHKIIKMYLHICLNDIPIYYKKLDYSIKTRKCLSLVLNKNVSLHKTIKLIKNCTKISEKQGIYQQELEEGHS